jgi:phosphatidate phosphatase LPIN
VERKPEEFKINCLESLKSLYSPEINPFIAGSVESFSLSVSKMVQGFGNRPSDVNSYTAVGIARSRIFIINPSGTITTGWNRVLFCLKT